MTSVGIGEISLQRHTKCASRSANNVKIISDTDWIRKSQKDNNTTETYPGEIVYSATRNQCENAMQVCGNSSKQCTKRSAPTDSMKTPAIFESENVKDSTGIPMRIPTVETGCYKSSNESGNTWLASARVRHSSKLQEVDASVHDSSALSQSSFGISNTRGRSNSTDKNLSKSIPQELSKQPTSDSGRPKHKQEQTDIFREGRGTGKESEEAHRPQQSIHSYATGETTDVTKSDQCNNIRSWGNFKQWYPRTYFAPLGKTYLKQSRESIPFNPNKCSDHKHLNKTALDNKESTLCKWKQMDNCSIDVLDSEKHKKLTIDRPKSIGDISEGHLSEIDFLDCTPDQKYLENRYGNTQYLDDNLKNTKSGASGRIRHKSMAEFDRNGRPMCLDYVRDDCEYDYDKSVPYRSNSVYRYAHKRQVDPFLPPGHSVRYASPIQCERAVPPDRSPLIAEQIFDEYQEKLAERLQRKASGTLRLNEPRNEVNREPIDYGIIEQLQKEFMGKVKERRSSDEDENSDENVQTISNYPYYKIDGTAKGLNEAILDDVEHLLKIDDSIDLQPHLREGLLQKLVRESVKTAAGRSIDSRPSSRLHALAQNESASQRSLSNYYNGDELYGTSHIGYDSGRKNRHQRQISPTLASLQKNKSNFYPKNAKYRPLDPLPPFAAPNEKLYTVKRQYEEELDGRIRRFFDLSRLPVEGVGPTTSYGVPVSLKSAVKEQYQPEWYRRMYGSMNFGKALTKKDEIDDVLSRWRNLDQNSSADSDNDIQLYSARRTPRFRNQPKRIEAYRPGKCSLSAKEAEEEKLKTPVTILQRKEEQDTLDGRRSAPPDRRRQIDSGSRLSSVHRHKISGRQCSPGLHSRIGYSERAKSSPPESFKRSSLNRQSAHNAQTKLKNCMLSTENKESNNADRTSSGKQTTTLPGLCEKHSLDSVGCEHMEMEDLMMAAYDQAENKHNLIGTKARVLHTFTPISSTELPLQCGRIVHVRRRVDEHWLEGELDGAVGIFPANYVEFEAAEHTEQCRQSQPHLGHARALYDFGANTDVELSFKKGDLITLTRRVDQKWFEGRLANRAGILPAKYVKIID